VSAGRAGQREATAAAGIEAALHPLLEGLPAPLMLLGEAGEIAFANAAMRSRLRQGGASKNLADEAPEYAAALAAGGTGPRAIEVMRTLPGGCRCEVLHVSASPLGTCLAVTDGRCAMPPAPANAQTTRLASLGFMIAGVCHEVANPLSAIHSMVQILQSRRGVTAETLEKGLANIATNLSRVLAITRRLASFSRVPGERCVPVAIDAAVDEAAALLRHNPLGATVAFEYRGAPDAVVLARPGQLQQVIFNTFLNAAQAMHGAGRVSVAATLRPAGNVELTIRDTGPGIEPAHLERIFEPFFTTKTEGEGTGLGLAISYEIVHELGGDLRAANDPETRGACFTIELPLLRDEET
jgi:nitrogen-specific signal transduction histidine kinase